MALGWITFYRAIQDAISHFEKLGYLLLVRANVANHFIALLTELGDKEGIMD
jgi:hypothetical protein